MGEGYTSLLILLLVSCPGLRGRREPTATATAAVATVTAAAAAATAVSVGLIIMHTRLLCDGLRASITMCGSDGDIKSRRPAVLYARPCPVWPHKLIVQAGR